MHELKSRSTYVHDQNMKEWVEKSQEELTTPTGGGNEVEDEQETSEKQSQNNHKAPKL